MLIQNRVLTKLGVTLEDNSIVMSDFLAGTKVIPYVTATDYIYLGSDLPFNHRYFDVKVANTLTSTFSVDLWSGSSWVPAIDIIDQTSVAGASLGKSGIISFTPDPQNSSWNKYETRLMTNSGLETLNILELYWARIKFSADLTSTTELQYIGHKFNEDVDLEIQYPQFSGSVIKTAFASGKTSWKDQTLTAAEYLIQDLREMNVILSANQILDANSFKMASVHKTAAIIFQAFGDDYKDNLAAATKSYRDNLKLKQYPIDKNKNATLDDQEKGPMSTYLTR